MSAAAGEADNPEVAAFGERPERLGIGPLGRASLLRLGDGMLQLVFEALERDPPPAREDFFLGLKHDFGELFQQ